MKHTLLLTFALTTLLAGCHGGVDGRSGATKKVKTPIKSVATATSFGSRPGLNGTLLCYNPATPDQAPMYRGGIILNIRGITELTDRGVKSILCPLTEPELPELAQKGNVQFQSIHFTGTTLDLATAKALIAYMKAAPKPMYLCCHGGSHRAGILAMLYRIHVQRASYAAAEEEFFFLGGSTVKDAPMLEIVRQTLKK
ncbi:MAG: hypothetical protein HN370_08380 [Phycisphaerales bacterium]|nr:hypothetical protein [Phycisphaerales bacterium]